MEGGGYLAGEAGEPAYATLRRLLRTPPRLAVAGRTVYVCESGHHEGASRSKSPIHRFEQISIAAPSLPPCSGERIALDP
jgi:hypothetical protein